MFKNTPTPKCCWTAFGTEGRQHAGTCRNVVKRVEPFVNNEAEQHICDLERQAKQSTEQPHDNWSAKR